MTDLQNERAFQKQEGVFLASKKLAAKKTSSGVRFYKKIGLGKLLRLRESSVSQRRVYKLDHIPLHSWLTVAMFANRLQDPSDCH